MPGSRATHLEIQKWIVRHHGFVPETGWIEQCKEAAGIAPAGTVITTSTNPCPLERKPAIIQAFLHFGILSASCGSARQE